MNFPATFLMITLPSDGLNIRRHDDQLYPGAAPAYQKMAAVEAFAQAIVSTALPLMAVQSPSLA